MGWLSAQFACEPGTFGESYLICLWLLIGTGSPGCAEMNVNWCLLATGLICKASFNVDKVRKSVSATSGVVFVGNICVGELQYKDIFATTDEKFTNADDFFANTHENFTNTDDIFANTDDIFATTDDIFATTDDISANTDEKFANTDENIANTDENKANTDDIFANADENTASYF